MFLESAVAKVLEKHEIEALHLRKKITIGMAKEKRRKHYFLDMFKELGEKNQ